MSTPSVTATSPVDGGTIAGAWGQAVYTDLTSLAAFIADMSKVVEKGSDTSRASTSTLADDPALTLAVSANASYIMNAFVIFGAGGAASTNGFKFAWTGPSGATMNWVPHTKIDTDATNAATSIWMAQRDIGTTISSGGAGANTIKVIARPYGLLKTSSTAGSLTLQWAQATSNGTATIVYAGSWIELRRVS